MTYAWIILEDHMIEHDDLKNGERSRIGTLGPRTLSTELHLKGYSEHGVDRLTETVDTLGG